MRLVERQNRTIKNSLVKVLDANPTQWPYIIEGILFAHRVSRHSSTKYSPFFLLYNGEPILPVDVKYNPSSTTTPDEPYDMEMSEAVLTAATAMREEVQNQVSANIKKAQEKQKNDFNSRHLSSVGIKIGDKVLVRNNKMFDRKGGKFTYLMDGTVCCVASHTKRTRNVGQFKNKI